MSRPVKAGNKGISKARRRLKKYERERVNRASRRVEREILEIERIANHYRRWLQHPLAGGDDL